MVSNEEATKIIKKTFPGGEIEAGPADYKNLKIFMVVTDDAEGELDNVYGVNPSKDVVGVSVMSDISGILGALQRAKK